MKLFPSLSATAACLLICLVPRLQADPSPTALLRDGEAKYRALPVENLPPGTDPKLFGGEVVGNNFELFLRDAAAQTLTLEIGFVDTTATAPGEDTFSLSANGSPVDANLDVFAKAGGANKPWVMKTTFVHAGGSLALQFVGLAKPAFVSYVRITGADGKEVGFGTAQNWMKGERLTLLDSRHRPFHKVAVGEVPFFDVDHSPVGSWSTLIYGMENSGGVQVCKQPGGQGTLIPDQGMIVAVKNGAKERLMPFASVQKDLPAGTLITDKEVTRKLGACTDAWTLPMGVSWTHYTPVWHMQDWDKATDAEKRRFVLPVTWMQYHIDNRTGTAETQVLFSLEQSAQPSPGWEGFDGYVVDQTSSIAVKKGDAELVTADQVKKDFGIEGATSAFRIHVPAGTEKTVTFYVAQYLPGVESSFEYAPMKSEPLHMMCDALYNGVEDILKTARDTEPQVIARCQKMDKKLADCPEDDERKFLAADALHSYQYNTVLHATDKKQPIWTVIEGECSCINTFDLTVDHVFYELAMHPWTVRNELDNFAYPFSYVDELSLPGKTEMSPGGLGFCHDMGSRLSFSTQEKGARYPNLMTQEELQNWIICAALYWKTTGDNAWLQGKKDVLTQALKSMQLRDDLDPAKRDGITTYASNYRDRIGKEITTYDAMDASLQHPVNSLYITGKSLACYIMLQPLFKQLDEPDLLTQAKDAEGYTVKGLLAHWDATKHSFPALFGGTAASSSIIPAVEGLAYPYAMGLTDDVSLTGPNAELMKDYKTHLQTILVPGVCVDAETGAWNLSSSSKTTWVSKVYLNQYVTEQVLGLKNDVTGKTADEANYAYEVLGAPAVGWTDQFYTSTHVAYGCRHYPRGVTSALWWLWPLPSSPSALTSR
jgi:hypothetical protein